MPSEEELLEEEKKMRRLKFLVSMTCNLLWQGDFTLREAQQLLVSTKEQILSLFPDKEGVYNLIYRPRFERIILERYGPGRG